MATRLKPTRINVDNTPRVGDGAAYQNDNDFHWSMGGGDMAYEDFEWVTLTGNSLVIENISNNVTPTGNFTVSAGTLKPGIEYVLRVNTGNTAYTMTLGTGVTNPNGYSTELTPNKVNQFKFIATSDSQLELEGVDTSEYLTGLTILSYGTSTWNDFITAYNKNVIVYCRASSNSNPATGAQNRLAFMAYVNNATNPTEVEFQYYRSRSDHNTQANQLDQVFVYTLTSANGGTWSVTERNTGAKAVAGTGINLAFGSGNMTISADTTVLATQTDLNSKANATDVNTKTFYLSNLSDLTTAQAAYDWYVSGKNPILVYSNCAYILVSADSSNVIFRSSKHAQTDNASYSAGKEWEIKFYLSSGTVTNYSNTNKEITPKVLATDVDYSTPYTPAYNGSPATKKYVDDKIISSSTAPSSPTEGMLWYDTTNDQLKVYNGSQWNVTGKEYNAGPGIEIGTYNDYSAMRGPAPEGFHVPLSGEWESIISILTTTFSMSSNNSTTATYLKMPSAGYRYWTTASPTHVGDVGGYRAANDGRYLRATSTILNPNYNESKSCAGRSVRLFKDVPEIPDSTWTVLYDGSSIASNAGIFHNITKGLISVSGDGQTWITIADKNLGATTAYNNGATLSESNCGGYFQKGNNYMFSFDGNVTTSSTQVDASTYGPDNYYSSSTFITGSGWWDSSDNNNLWGGVTGVVTIDNAITNTGVLSVNGQTGAVTINEGDVKVFEVPSVNDDISDMITRISAGKGVILHEMVSGTDAFYKVDYHDDVTQEITASLLYSYNGGYARYYTIVYNYSTKKVSTKTPSLTYFFAPETAGTQGQVLTKTNSGYEWAAPQGTTYNAGEGIEINNNSISAKAGTGIAVGDGSTDYSAMRGPCPEGYHIPENSEWNGLKTITNNLGLTSGDSLRVNLHMPFTGYRESSDSSLNSDESMGEYWTVTTDTINTYAFILHIDEYDIYSISVDKSYGSPIRPFKDRYVSPDNTWTVIQGTLGSAGIFWNQIQGLITITNGTTGYTIMDKNLGATAVYNDGDTLSNSNCGTLYQRGNNYGFPRTGSVTTSSTQIDTSNYGPGNYYSSSTFITGYPNWDSSGNNNLRGGVTGAVVSPNGITNTGVLSVNGQTGNVTIETFQLAPNSPLNPKYRRYGTQAQYEALAQYYTDEPGDTVYFTI